MLGVEDSMAFLAGLFIGIGALAVADYFVFTSSGLIGGLKGI